MTTTWLVLSLYGAMLSAPAPSIEACALAATRINTASDYQGYARCVQSNGRPEKTGDLVKFLADRNKK